MTGYVDSVFKRWLNQCILVPPSVTELERCKATIEFIGTWPSDPRITGWLADFLYCVSKDFLIKWLATRGVLAFGMEDLEPALLKERNDGFGHLDHLALLRKAKAAYRSSKPIPKDTEHSIRTWLVELTTAFSLNKPSTLDQRPEIILSKLCSRTFSSSYELLRSVEVAYHIARSYDLTHPEHDHLIKHITCPNAYGSSQVRKRTVMERYLRDITFMMANNAPHSTQKTLCSHSVVLR